MEVFRRALVSVLIVLLQGLWLSDGQGDFWDPDTPYPDELLPPTFRDTPKTVRVREGALARLQCTIDNLGTKKVTWRRNHDRSPLTIEKNVFSHDKRISVEHRPLTPHWNLIIKQVKASDTGQYECQVATSELTRRYVFLKVISSQLISQGKRKTKKGGPLIHRDHNKTNKIMSHSEDTVVEKNNPLSLWCYATTGNGEWPDDIDWFFNGQILHSDPSKGLTIEKKVQLMNRSIESTLRIRSVQLSDTGVYICRTSASQVGNIRVDVLNADSKNSKRGTEQNSGQGRGNGIPEPRMTVDETKNGCGALRSSSPALVVTVFAACLVNLLVNSRASARTCCLVT